MKGEIIMRAQYDTQISRNNFEHIKRRNITPSELIDFLESGALYRSFQDVKCTALQKINQLGRHFTGPFRMF